MNQKEQGAFNVLPKPEGATFRLSRVTTMVEPHLYCITPRHVAVASDHHCGMLGEAAVEDAEKRGAHCGVKGCRLPYGQHVSSLAAVIVVAGQDNQDLNSIPGLHAYLVSVKDAVEAAGIKGFMFPTEAQEQRATAA